GTHGALWLIGWRFVQAFGGSMLMANSAAILTDAFPEGKRGTALGINQVAGISGQFIGLLLGSVTFAFGAGILLVAITFGIRPYRNEATSWGNPMVFGALILGAALLAL